MLDYHILRLFLFAAESSLILLIIRRNLGYLFPFVFLLWISATAHLLPAQLSNSTWWSAAYLPIATIRLSAAIWVSFDFFRYLRKCVPTLERLLVLISVTSLGLMTAWFLRWWRPVSAFDAANVVRQYAWLVLAVSFSGYLRFYTRSKPVSISFLIAEHRLTHGLLWCGWLWTAFFLSTATQGGLLWLVFEWKDNEIVWRAVGDLGLLAQLSLSYAWWVNLRHLPIVRSCPIFASSVSEYRPTALTPPSTSRVFPQFVLPYTPDELRIRLAIQLSRPVDAIREAVEARDGGENVPTPKRS